MLKVSNLTKKFTSGESIIKAVDNVSLIIKEGEFVSIMGPSGSGKSTFLNLIGGIERPTSGTIQIGRQQIEGLSENELAIMRRKNVAFIYQFFSLLPELSAEENIILPLLIAKRRKQEWKEKLEQVLTKVNLTKRRNHLPSELSGGEQQRVAVARALMVDPNLLLADEPTGSLDTRQGQIILEILRESVEKTDQTLIMVTHDSKIAAYADRIIYFRDGRIIDETNNNNLNLEKVSAQLKRPFKDKND